MKAVTREFNLKVLVIDWSPKEKFKFLGGHKYLAISVPLLILRINKLFSAGKPVELVSR